MPDNNECRIKMFSSVMQNPLRLRLAVALLMGLVITAICWNLGYGSLQGDYERWARIQVKHLRYTAQGDEEFRARHGRWRLTIQESEDSQPTKSGRFRTTDYRSQKPLQLSISGSKPLVTALGKDHLLGGRGLNADLTNQTTDFTYVHEPVSEFFLNPRMQRPILWGLACGIMTGLLTFISVRPKALDRASVIAGAIALAVLLFCSTYVSLIITMLHYPSGH